MSNLTKDYYRQQYNFAKRELEKKFDMFGLNQTQKQVIRESVDRLLEEQRKEYSAPEAPQGDSNDTTK